MEELTAAQKKVNETKKQLDSVSPSFCLAKWLQATIHLHRGLTHSCHHPPVHSVPLRELSGNVAALHNTKEKIETRRQMMNGKRPAGCEYCWNIEDLANDRVSDRVLKSKDNWAMPFMPEVLKDPLSNKILPKYLEISFSRACNFRCSYCSPAFSTKWAQDVLQDGPYPGREKDESLGMLHEPFTEETNPYIKAFWEWWPELKSALHTFRITGGEPLLSPNTYKVVEMLRKDPAPGMEFSINSNLGIPRAKLQQLVEGIKDLLENKKIKNFVFFTSIEAWGPRAEYIRNGLDAELFWSNVEYVLESLPTIHITIMSTFNALSVTSFLPFLEKVTELRQKYSNEYHPSRLIVDISYLRHPEFQAINILPAEYQPLVKECVNYIEKNSVQALKQKWGYFDFEVQKITRTYEWMLTPPKPEHLTKRRITFYNYFTDHDRRRGTDFLGTYPEMAKFFEDCRREARGLPPMEFAEY